MLPFLAPVAAGCYVAAINPASCIAFNLIRYMNYSAVAYLKEIFNGYIVSPDHMLTGMVSGSPTSVVLLFKATSSTYWMTICQICADQMQKYPT